MKFVVSDHNSPALFAHMVKSANSEIERAKFLADITYLELSQRHDELGPYFDEDGVPTFHDIEDAQFAERIEQIISRIYHCCQICFVEANYESQKAAANALLKSLKFGTASEKKYLGNLFDPSMTGLVLEADSDFLADYLIVCSKTLETLVLFRILPRIGQVLPLRYTNRIIDAVFHHVKNRGASDFSQPIAEYLNRIRERDPDVYATALERLKAAVVDSDKDDLVRLNDTIIDAFEKLGERPPDYVPF